MLPAGQDLDLLIHLHGRQAMDLFRGQPVMLRPRYVWSRATSTRLAVISNGDEKSVPGDLWRIPGGLGGTVQDRCPRQTGGPAVVFQRHGAGTQDLSPPGGENALSPCDGDSARARTSSEPPRIGPTIDLEHAVPV